MAIKKIVKQEVRKRLQAEYQFTNDFKPLHSSGATTATSIMRERLLEFIFPDKERTREEGCCTDKFADTCNLLPSEKRRNFQYENDSHAAKRVLLQSLIDRIEKLRQRTG